VDGYVIDWHLLLDFVKALAPPVAAVTGVWLAGQLAVRGFRRQKMIERRLNWYDEVLERLEEMVVTAEKAVTALGDEALLTEARTAAYSAIRSVSKAHVYAERSGFDALAKWGEEVHPIVTSALTPDAVQRLRAKCSEISVALSVEVRSDLLLKQLYPSPPSRVSTNRA
jgi:hypothetical protein